jgi:hypothetical protein
MDARGVGGGEAIGLMRGRKKPSAKGAGQQQDKRSGHHGEA